MGTPDRYTCEHVFKRLDLYLDRELTWEEVQLVEEHLAICVVCAREYAFERSLLEGLKERIRRIEVPRSVIEKIESVLKSHAPGNPAEPG